MNISSCAAHRTKVIKNHKFNEQSHISNEMISCVTASLAELSKNLNAAAADGEHSKVMKLIANGASVHAAGPLGMNPLHLASMNGHIEVCKFLLNSGVMIDCRNKLEKTALHLASMNGHFEVVQYLLSLGATADAVDMLKMTPLHWACDRGHTKVAKLLLLSGADPDKLNKFCKSPWKLAIENGHKHIVAFIDEYKDNCSESSSCESLDECLNPSSAGDQNSLTSNQRVLEDDNSAFSSSTFREQFTPEEDDGEKMEHSKTGGTDRHFRDELLKEESFGSPEKRIDHESVIQDKLLESVNMLNEMVSQRRGEEGNLSGIYASAASELLRAQAALVPLDDPSRMLRRAINYGQTIQLTEAGERALAMIRPEPFIVPKENSEKKETETSEKPSSEPSSSASPPCSAVVLRNKTPPNPSN